MWKGVWEGEEGSKEPWIRLAPASRADWTNEEVFLTPPGVTSREGLGKICETADVMADLKAGRTEACTRMRSVDMQIWPD